MVKIIISEMFKDIDSNWISILTSKELMPKLKTVIEFLNKETSTITPSPNNIFNFARHTRYSDVKVVILGQDPYPQPGEANGLAFSCNNVQGSLTNIYKCLKNQKIIENIPKTGDLTHWAQQGVLLLNTSLTTVEGKSNAHKDIWADFTDILIKKISHDINCGPAPSLMFFLWGNYAINKKALINEDCIIYEWRHPSPLAQSSAKLEEKFINCNHFVNANEFFKSEGMSPIDWNPVSTNLIYTDGACSGNGKGIAAYAGYAAYFSTGIQAGLVKYGRIPPSIVENKTLYPSNQRAEGLAICIALEESKAKHNTIITDSQFWINMIEEWMPLWNRKGIQFEEKANSDITKRLWNLVKDNAPVLIHVESHGKNKSSNQEHVRGNEIADKYAVKAKNLDTFTNHDEQI